MLNVCPVLNSTVSSKNPDFYEKQLDLKYWSLIINNLEHCKVLGQE